MRKKYCKLLVTSALISMSFASITANSCEDYDDIEHIQVTGSYDEDAWYQNDDGSWDGPNSEWQPDYSLPDLEDDDYLDDDSSSDSSSTSTSSSTTEDPKPCG